MAAATKARDPRRWRRELKAATESMQSLVFNEASTSLYIGALEEGEASM